MTEDVFISICVLIIIYVIGFAISITNSTTSYHCRDDFSYVDTETRNAEPKDAWLALLWPLKGILSILFAVLDCINSLIQYPLLLLGIRYKDTKLSKWINKCCDNKY